MRPENTPVGPTNHATNQHQGPDYSRASAVHGAESLKEAERSASAAAALASASQAAEAAEAASTVAAAEAAKRRATERATGAGAASAGLAGTTAAEAAAIQDAPQGSTSSTPAAATGAGASAPGSASTQPATPTPQNASTPQNIPASQNAAAPATSVAAHDSVVAPTVAGANQNPHHPGKGFIVALVVLGVASLALLGCVLWFFLIYSQPTTVVKDALAKLLTADRVVSVAESRLTGDGFEINNTSGLSFGKSEGLYAKAELKISGTSLGPDTTLTGTLQFSAPEHSRVYANVTGLTSAYDWYANTILVDAGYDAMGYTVEDLEAMVPFLSIMHGIADEAEGTWWGLTGEEAEPVQQAINFYKCTVSSLTSEASVNNFIASYDQHPFLTGEKYNDSTINSSDAYKVTVDEQALTDFLNAVYGETIYPNLNTCLATSGLDSADLALNVTDENFTLEEVQAWQLNEALAHYTFIIDGFSHQLVRTYYSETLGEESDAEADHDPTVATDTTDTADETMPRIAVVTDYTYPAGITISDPEEFRNASELYESTVTLLNSVLGVGVINTGASSPMLGEVVTVPGAQYDTADTSSEVSLDGSTEVWVDGEI